jgi:hypothetical protein
VDITPSQQVLTAIVEQQSALKLSERELISGIMNSTTWWRVRTNQSQLSLQHAIQLLSRVSLSFKVYKPEIVMVHHHANNTTEQAKAVAPTKRNHSKPAVGKR